MKPVFETRALQMARIDHALEYAVVQSWDDLMPNSTSGIIHIEYHAGDSGSLDFLKIWACEIRGHWNLVCEFWVRPLWSHTTGLTFGGDYYSRGLASALELIISHEDALAQVPKQHGLIEICAPTQAERDTAERWTKVAFNRDGTVPSTQQIAG